MDNLEQEFFSLTIPHYWDILNDPPRLIGPLKKNSHCSYVSISGIIILRTTL